MTDDRSVAVLGGGVVGVAMAWYLAREVCRVILIERNPGPGLETSFANAGLITPSMSDPWGSPGLPLEVLRWLGRENAPFLLRPRAVPGLLSWGYRFLRECNRDAWHRNTRTILRLCAYSHEALRALVAETGIEYDSNPRGTLRLIRDRLSMKKTEAGARVMEELGVEYRTLDAEGGDAFLFTERLAALCASNGVELRYGETVRAIETEGGRFARILTDQ